MAIGIIWVEWPTLTSDDLEIIGHKDDQIMFEQPGIMSTFAIPGLELKPVQITRWVEHGDQFRPMG